MILFYIRHGDPIYRPDSLTPLGHQQADALSKRLVRCGLNRIYTSTSTRAKQTAEPTVNLTKLQPVELDWAREHYAFEEFSLLDPVSNEKRWCFQSDYYCELFNTPEIYRLGDKWASYPGFAELSFAKGMERINTETDAFFLSLGYRHDRKNHCYIAECPNDERIAFFAHQGFGFAFLSSLLDIPYPLFATHFDLGHSSMSVIEFQSVGDKYIPRMLQSSNDSHIYKEELPTKYQNRLEF